MNVAHPVLHIVYASLMLAILLAEYWLGKTDKTKAGSILELIGLVILGGVAWAFKKEEKKDDGKGSQPG